VFIATKVRTGLTPAVNALALVLIVVAILGAIAYEIARQRQQRVG
jgi:spermidine/putrescine transport system permease protein